MGCGQSKIHLYPRKSKSKANGKKGAHADSDAETDEDEGGHIEDNEQTQCQERDKGAIAEESSNKDATPDVEEEVSLSLFRAKNFSLLQSQLSKRREISTSQQNFFRMLDKKIEEGPDYDSASETEIALEEARLNALVQHWESASITASICSSASRSLQTTPVRHPPITKQMPTPRMMLQNQATYLQAPGDYMIQQQLQGGVMLAPISKQQIQQQQLQQQQHHQLAANLQQQQQQQQLYAKIIQQHTLNNLGINLHLGSATGATTTATPSAAASSAGAATTLIQPLTSNGGASLIPTTISTASSTISPKHAVDELLVQQHQQQQQQQQQMLMHLQNQYNNVNIELSATNVKYINGGRSPPLLQQQQQQQAQPLTHNYEYYEQQQQQQQQEQQQQQQQLEQQQQGGVAYYGELTATSSSPGVLPATPAPPQQQQQPPPPPTEYRFPPAISVQRLAPQVQRQLRETQELIKDSCPQLYATGYGSPGPPMRNQTRHHLGANRRPTLETQFSQELS